MRWVLVSSVVLLLLVLVSTARAGDLMPEMVCKTSKKLSMRRNPGRGNKRLVKADSLVEVLSVSKSSAYVRIGRRKGYMSRPALTNACLVNGTRLTDIPNQEAGSSELNAELEPLPAPPNLDAARDPNAIQVSPSSSPGSGGPEAFGGTYKIKVAVLRLRAAGGLDEEVVASLTNVIPETLDALGPFKAISSQDILQMLVFEEQRQLLGCDDQSCLAEIGGALGADFMVTGTLTATGTSTVIQLQLMNIGESRVDARISKESSSQTQALFEAVEAATKQLVRDVLGQRSGSLSVTVSEEGATIMIDNAIVGVSPLALPLIVSGGNHALSVEKEGFVVYRKDVSVFQDQAMQASVNLRPSDDFIKRYEREARFWHGLAWLALGGGVAGVGTGVGLVFYSQNRADKTKAAVDSYNDKSLRTQEEYDSLERRTQRIANYDVAATIAASAGVTALVTGIVLFATGDDPDKYEGITTAEPAISGVTVTPAGIGVSGQF